MKGKTIAAIDVETNAARAKHGSYVERVVIEQNHDAALRVLVEEVGEVAAALNDLCRGEPALPNLRAELVQVAATAVRWIEALDVRDGVGQHVREAGK